MPTKLDGWKEYELGQLLNYEQPSPYIVKSTNYSDTYSTPVLTAGKSFIIGYTDETVGIYNSLPVIIFDDFTTASQYVNFPFKVKSSAMKILSPNVNLVLPKFIYYRMQIIQFDHSTHKRYWIQQYSKIKVQIPSIPEQERIISKIEELFSRLDASVVELQTAKEKLKVYRQAVLKEAFDPVCTEYVSLGDIIEKPRYGTSKKCSYAYNDTSKAVYRIPNIRYQDGTIDHRDIKYTSFSDEELNNLELLENDILIIRSNGSVSLVGRSSIIRPEDCNATFAGYLIRLRLKKSSAVSAKFLHYFLESHTARTYIENIAKSTSGVNNINSAEICHLPVPKCDNFETQAQIVEKIETHLSICDNIEEAVDTSLQKTAAIRQCILKLAFEGRLIDAF